MASKEAAILRLLAGAGNQEKDTSDNNNNDIGSDELRAPFNTASATNSLSLLTSRIGNFLEQAKNAPTDQMHIEIDEEVLEEEDTDDEETDDSDNDGLEFNPETMRFYRNPNHLQQQQKQKMMVEAPSSKRRKVDADESVSKKNPVMVEVVAEKNGDDDDDDDDAQDDSTSTSSSDIDIVTFSSDDDDDDGIDLSKLSEEKKKKLTALFSGKLMQQQQQQNKFSAPKLVDAPIPKKGTKKQQTQNKKDLLKFENDNDNENEKQNDNDDDEYEEEEPFDPSDPLRGKYIQMNLIAGVIQEDRKKLQQQRNGDIVLPTPKELVFEKKKRKKNQKKMSQLVKALVSTE